MTQHDSHETFPLFGRLGSHQSTRYYHQDPHCWSFHRSLTTSTLRHTINISCYLYISSNHIYSRASTVRFSAIHFRGWKIRQVSSYTLLSQFRLPWPWPCCLYKSTPFLVSSWADILAFYPDVRCIPHRQFCLPELAH